MPVTGIDSKVIMQVCVMVRDIEQSAARYAAIFGFDLPEIQETLERDHTQATYYGQPTDARARLCFFNIGRIQLELIQPLGAPSVWGDFIDQHGEGIQHIAFFVPRSAPAAASFADFGYPVAQQGLFTGRTGMYTYLNTDKDLGITLELLENYNGDPVRSAPTFDPNKGIGTDTICQVGIIVRDIEKAVRHYVEVLGLPDTPIIETQGYATAKTTYHGQPSEATAKLAFFSLGQVQIELIEPDEQRSVWRDFLDQHGEGAHHIAFPIKDTRRVTDYLAGHGVAVTQQGLYTDGSGMYTYLDTQAQLGTTVELLESFSR